MSDYTIRLIRQEMFKTAQWSGGTTTELAIAPEDGVYADRNFLWRLSSATVDLEESTFTSLPDYNRLIMTLRGGIRLAHNGGKWIELPEFTAHAFDGGDETVSVGKVVDFNLMMRKGRCTGALAPRRCAEATGEAGEPVGRHLLLEALDAYDTILFYCWRGALAIVTESKERHVIGEGEALRMDGSFENAAWKFEAEAGTDFVAAAMCTK